MVEYLVHHPGLDDAAGLHHGDAVAHMLDDAEIMRNEWHRQAQPRPQRDRRSSSWACVMTSREDTGQCCLSIKLRRTR
jgi:hypothetical protein